MKKILAASLLVIGVIHSKAQEKEQTLDPVTITSSLQAKPVSQTGRNITSFKGQEFNNLPIHSVDELLRYLPGVEVQMRGPMGAQSDIVLRGGTFQQVLVLLDGIRINDPNTGHFTSYIPIAPAEIERVEVLKGASSAIYGSEAVGGVIQIITKTFAARQKQNKLQVQAQASAGEYQLMNANGGVFYQKENTAIGAGLLSLNTNGQQQRGTKGFLNNNTFSASVSHFISKRWQLAVRGAYDSRDFAAQNFYTTFASDTASEKVQSAWGMARLSYTGDKHRISINTSFKSLRDQYLFSKAAVANDNRSKMLQALVTDEWTISPKTTLISGAQFINKKIRSNDRGNHEVPQHCG
jgi:vitamin B12 transporter